MNSTKRLERSAAILKTLAAKKSIGSEVIYSLDMEVIACIRDVVQNYLNENLELSSVEQAKLSEHREILIKIANTTDTNAIKRLLANNSSFLPTLLRPVLKRIYGSN